MPVLDQICAPKNFAARGLDPLHSRLPLAQHVPRGPALLFLMVHGPGGQSVDHLLGRSRV